MRKPIRRLPLFLLACIIVTVLFAGCSGNDAAGEPDEPGETEKPRFIKNETESRITIIDPLGDEVTLDKKPQRVVILMNSILDLWYMAGGTAIGRVSGTENVPPEAEDIAELGSIGSPNIERIIALQPDLIIMSSTMQAHRDLKDVFDQNKIPYLYVNCMVYDDFIDYLDLFTRMTGREDIFKTGIADINHRIKDIIDMVSGQKKPRVLMLFSTARSVQCELTNGLDGDMINMLGAENIASDASVGDATRVEFSMERIVERDPDIILIATMGDVEKCKERIKEDIESSQAWAGLRAVKEGNIHYLPKDLFIYKPNARYPEAIEYLAKILYPGVNFE